MSIYVNDKNKVTDIYVNVNGSKKKIASAWANKNGLPTKVFQVKNNDYFANITWADGSWEDIAMMLDAHYAGVIDIHDYWHVGDKRVVHLNDIYDFTIMDGSYLIGEQDINIVLVNAGGKTLVNPVNDKSECAFIVMQENRFHRFLNNNYGNWCDMSRRNWLNTNYYNSFPIASQSIFKMFQNSSTKYTYNSDFLVIDQEEIITDDYFSLPSEKEISGIIFNSDNIENAHQQFSYFSSIDEFDEMTTRSQIRTSVKNLCSVYKQSGVFKYSYCNIKGYYYFYPIGCI